MGRQRVLSTPHGALGTLTPRQARLKPTSLSTPHGALGTSSSSMITWAIGTFQLHTVHQEHTDTLKQKRQVRCLSTPHGALGTVEAIKFIYRVDPAFNSTRCIRNLRKPPSAAVSDNDTFNSTRCIRNGNQKRIKTKLYYPFNSTRCIRNLWFLLFGFRFLIYSFNSTRCIRNSMQSESLSFAAGTFNSTRCIRNNRSRKLPQKSDKDFQLHTVHQEQEMKQILQKSDNIFQLHTVHQELYSYCLQNSSKYYLSTPHGALGTKYSS